MKKKGIVLLMSLVFITTISVFILQSLSYSQSLIQKSATEDERAQLHLAIHNIKQQLINLVFTKKEELETIFPIEELQFGVENVVDINVKKIELFNNKLNIYKQTLSSKLNDYITNMEITSNKQTQHILTNYLKKYDDDLIKDVKENFTYFDTELNDFIYCSFDVILQNIQGSVEFIFNKNTKEVVDFDVILTK